MSIQYWIIVTLAVISALFTVIGNGVFFITISRTPSLHTPSNVLLASLSLADILVGIVCQPLLVAMIQQPLHPCCSNLDLVYRFTASAIAGASFWLVILITGDRLLSIFHPFKYILIASCRKSICIAIITFGVCLLNATISLLFYEEWATQILLVEISLMVLTLSFNVISYSLIYRVIHRRKRAVGIGQLSYDLRNKSRTERIQTNTIAFILLAFIGCTSPYLAFSVHMLLYNLKKSSFIPGFMEWTNFIFFLNSAVNPYIYFLRRSDIRLAAKRLLFRNAVNDNTGAIHNVTTT